jgi:hypothetical protein
MVNEQIFLGEHLPLFMREKPAFVHIMNSENREIEAVSRAVREGLDNSFAAYADDSPRGIARWERILGIIPKRDDSVQTRRLEILTRMNDRLPYTTTTLQSALIELFGANGTARHSLNVNSATFSVTVTLHSEIAHLQPIVLRFVRGRVPANMTVSVV